MLKQTICDVCMCVYNIRSSTIVRYIVSHVNKNRARGRYIINNVNTYLGRRVVSR